MPGATLRSRDGKYVLTITSSRTGIQRTSLSTRLLAPPADAILTAWR
jgi:hypothetical protein